MYFEPPSSVSSSPLLWQVNKDLFLTPVLHMADFELLACISVSRIVSSLNLPLLHHQ